MSLLPRLAPARDPATSAQAAQTCTFASALACIAVVALVLRLAVLLWIPTLPVSDAWSYIDLAKNLIEEGGYQWRHVGALAWFREQGQR